ncbi:MAG TPA: DinB family protein [Blastocatellia bacterium]|nr:DinB family protein [Blastocatellia bacterium]
MSDNAGRDYEFLLDTCRTEVLKTTGSWSAFPDSAMDFRPHPKSRTVIEQMEHQVQSEGRWMKLILGLETGDPMPDERTRQGFIEKYRADADRRLELLRGKPDEWWREVTNFFDVERTRAWIMTRRINHSTHHRGQLVVYLRLLDLPLPSVYGPTADTGDRVIYSFDQQPEAR